MRFNFSVIVICLFTLSLLSGCGGVKIKDYNEQVGAPNIPLAGGAPEQTEEWQADAEVVEEPGTPATPTTPGKTNAAPSAPATPPAPVAKSVEMD